MSCKILLSYAHMRISPYSVGRLLLILLCFTGVVWAQVASQELPNFDIRLQKPEEALVETAQVTKEQLQASEDLKRRIPGVQVRWNPFTGTPKSVYSLRRFLTGPSDVGPRTIALDFVGDNAQLYGLQAADLEGLTVTREFISKRSGVRHLTFQQEVDGIIVYFAELRVNLTARGEVINTASGLIPSVSEAVNIKTPAISPEQALRIAAANIGIKLDDTPELKSGPEGPMQKRIYSKGEKFSDDIPVRLLYYPMSRTEVRLVWEVIVGRRSDPNVYQIFIDAENGQMLYRVNLTDYQVPQWRVFTSDSPAPMSPGTATPDGTQPAVVSRQLITTNGDATASPPGWIPSGGTTTTGNNADAFIDTNDDGTPDGINRPIAANRIFDFPLDLTQSPNTNDNQRSAVVNAFYWCNLYHDILYDLGFDETVGNFQDVNQDVDGDGTPDGVGGDYIRIRIHSGTDNSRFFTPPGDGGSPIWRIYTFTGPNPDRDAALDQEIGIHELTHGLTNRLVGGPTVKGLTETQSKAMGEGWSDFYALTMLSKAVDDLDGNYAFVGYSTLHWVENPPNWDDNYYFGIRRFPHSTNMNTSPLTFADIDTAQFDYDTTIPINPWRDGTSASQIHNAGEIWCLALWECRANLIRKHGFATGNQLTLQLVTDGLPLLSRNPDFIEARDAVLLADRNLTGGANQCALWLGFAKRGMGVGATAPDAGTTSGVFESFDASTDTCRNPVDIALVLDISGSMSSIAPGGTEPKIQVLKDAVEAFMIAWEPFAMSPNDTGVSDRMGVSYFESNVTTYSDAPFLLPFLANMDAIWADVDGKPTGNCTAMGGGLITAIRGFSPEQYRNRHAILFTDGMQNYNPKVVGPLGSQEIIQTTDPPVFGDSGVLGEPGTYLQQFYEDFGSLTIHTIGTGVSGASYESLLVGIADDTGGLHDFTEAPDHELEPAFLTGLVDALKGTTVELVRDATGTINRGSPDKTESFTINGSAKKAVFILSWRGERRPNALTFRLKSPDGTEIDLTDKLKQGDFYTRAVLQFPLRQTSEQIEGLREEKIIDHQGVWQMIISEHLEVDSVFYHAYLLIDDVALKYDFSIARKDYGTGDAIPLSVFVRENGEPVTELSRKVVRVTRPRSGLGTFLSAHYVSKEQLKKKIELHDDHFATLVDKKAYILLGDPKLRAKLQPQTEEIELFDDGLPAHGDAVAGDGIFSARCINTKLPGQYRFEFLIEGRAPQGCDFVRSKTFSTVVRVKRPSLVRTVVTTRVIDKLPDGSPVVLFKVIPQDAFGNYLGPGYPGEIRISTTAGDLGPVKDNLDGSYTQELIVTALSQDPTITITVLGTKVSKEPLSEYLVRVGRLALSAHVGAAIPVGDLADTMNSGLALDLDVEYPITSRLSLVLSLGHNQFYGDISNFLWLNASANVKKYFRRGSTQPYLQIGGGLYMPESGSNEPGFNAGAGISFIVNPRLSLELNADFHSIFTSGDKTQFFDIQIGLVNKL